jgi:hypothetical protein
LLRGHDPQTRGGEEFFRRHGDLQAHAIVLAERIPARQQQRRRKRRG